MLQSKDRHLVPTLRFKVTPSLENYLVKWVEAYFKGKNGRPSLREGFQSGTFPDSLIKEIYLISHEVSEKNLDQIAKGHATMMTLEKIVGDLLEEYLFLELAPYGWHCCWGHTVKSVDFCHPDGRLLQVKTSDNSENSSSRVVRNNTSILIWKRRKSTKKDQYYWENLIELTGNQNLSEKGFRKFVRKVLLKNPACIHVNEPFKRKSNY